MPDHDHRVAVVGGLDGEPAGVAVHRPADDLVGLGSHPGLVEQLAQRDAAPDGVADEVPRRPRC
jgi:hypothetical protein